MKTSNTRRSGYSFSLLVRVLVLSGAVLAASACSAPSGTTEPPPATSVDTVEQSADEVGDALSEVSLQISAQMTGDEEDLVLAWNDFESDVRSVVRDLVSRPGQVDIEGMQQRVDALEKHLDDSALELPAAQWEEFIAAFQNLIDEASESKDSA